MVVSMIRQLIFIFWLGCLCSCKKPRFYITEFNADTIQLWQPLSIAGLKDLAGTSSSKQITNTLTISGKVIAHDKSGNLYKQIIIDDGTAAIPVLLDEYNLYAQFPLGKRVQVLCKGLILAESNKLPQLCFALDSQSNPLPIPSVLIPDYIKKAPVTQKTSPIQVRLSEIKKALPELYSRLVVLDSVEFTDSLLICFALPPELSTATNLYVRDCDSNVIALRTSAYAAFASFKPPTGSGSIKAVYSVYNNTPQLILLDTADLTFTQKRCSLR
jgi:hypothetical protein